MSIQANVTVFGEAMCASCFAGRPVSRKELAGDSGRGGADREADRKYYRRNRDKVLATHRKWREARGKSAPCVAV